METIDEYDSDTSECSTTSSLTPFITSIDDLLNANHGMVVVLKEKIEKLEKRQERLEYNRTFDMMIASLGAYLLTKFFTRLNAS